jgi:hypothetical protein
VRWGGYREGFWSEGDFGESVRLVTCILCFVLNSWVGVGWGFLWVDDEESR